MCIQEEPEVEVKWERWQKKRIFVREVSGKYAEAYHQLLEQPRVYKSKTVPFKGGRPSRQEYHQPSAHLRGPSH